MSYCRGLKKKWGTNHKFMNYDQNSLPDERKNCREKIPLYFLQFGWNGIAMKKKR
jgi:hypothetical protein